MKISIISVFPEIHETFFKLSLVGRAIEKGIISVNLVRLSDFCPPKSRIDEPTVGPGAGMIIKPEVLDNAITACQQQWGPGYKIFFSPQGNKLTQRVLKHLASTFFCHKEFSCSVGASVPSQTQCHIILVCPRYEGIDARVESFYADAVISIGDYVLMGGDLPAQVFLEGILRLLPGIVGNWSSVEHESFSGPFLDYPEYGLPVEWKSMRLPEIVQSGNHGAIEAWREDEACKKTVLRRFDWFASSKPNARDCARAVKFIPSHYVALMHTNVQLKDGSIGNTSITSIDLHDTARSCTTYGVKNFFMVSPLADQQAIIATLLDFWQSEAGRRYNQSRYHAVSKVRPVISLEAVMAAIIEQEGCAPTIIATSAKQYEHGRIIDYSCQRYVWESNKPVLLLFGTGQGLAEELIQKCDFLLIPVGGLTDYNHLSVRSAIAIVLDRWLGLHPILDPKKPIIKV